MKWKAFVALLAVALAVGIAASQAVGATTWTVDQTTGNNATCAATKNCKTITKAVMLAAAGDTIIVHPGTYSENVTVNKKLTIRAQNQAPDLLSCNDNRTTPDDTVYSIVEGGGGTAFSLTASGTTIDGFILQNSSVGVFTSASFSGYVIKNNLFQDNDTAIYLNSNGTTTVTNNCVRNSTSTGIYSDAGLKSATIGQNRFFGQASYDLVLSGGVNPAVLTTGVKGNISKESGSFLSLAVSKSVEVSGNIVSDTTDGSLDSSAAIVLEGSNNLFKIKGNIVQNGAGSGILLNVGGAPFNIVNKGTISGNIVQGMGHDGLFVNAGAMGASTVSSNIFNNNANDGIHIAKPPAAGVGNTLTGNIASNNPKHDCHDSTVKNTWTANTNIGTRVNKIGLCFPGSTVAGPQNHPPTP